MILLVIYPAVSLVDAWRTSRPVWITGRPSSSMCFLGAVLGATQDLIHRGDQSAAGLSVSLIFASQHHPVDRWRQRPRQTGQQLAGCRPRVPARRGSSEEPRWPYWSCWCAGRGSGARTGRTTRQGALTTTGSWGMRPRHNAADPPHVPDNGHRILSDHDDLTPLDPVEVRV